MVKLFKLTRNLSCFMERCFFRSDLTRYSSSEHTMKWNPTSAAGRRENVAKFLETTELCRKDRHFSLAYFFFFFSVDLLFACPASWNRGGWSDNLSRQLCSAAAMLGVGKQRDGHRGASSQAFLTDPARHTERNYIDWHPTRHVLRRLRVHLLCQYLQINLSRRSNILLSNRHNKSTVLPSTTAK